MRDGKILVYGQALPIQRDRLIQLIGPVRLDRLVEEADYLQPFGLNR